MHGFLDEHFLLPDESSRRLFHDYAESMPIFDYHCHLPPADLAGDVRFRSIAHAWLGGDHYKWRATRANGVPEEDITGGGWVEAGEAPADFAALGSMVQDICYRNARGYFAVPGADA